MSTNKMETRQGAPWLTAAMLAPLVHTAAGNNWAVTALTGGACLALRWWIAVCVADPPMWLRRLQGIWGWAVISQVMAWTADCWSGVALVPMLLLALAAWAASDTQRAARVGCVLVYPLVLLLGAVLISGVPDIRGDYLEAGWEMPTGALVSVLLIPSAGGRCGRRYGRHTWFLLAFALGASGVTAGVLSPRVAAELPAPINELSKSLSLLGVAERFESLTAAAMAMGFFAAMSYLLCIPTMEKDRLQWLGAAAALTLYLLDWNPDNGILLVGSILVWAVLPVAWGLSSNLRKKKKGIDKIERRC